MKVMVVDPHISLCQKITSMLAAEQHLTISIAHDCACLSKKEEQPPWQPPADMLIINQSFLANLEPPPRCRYIVLATDVSFHHLYWAYAQGALGYLLATAPATLWRSALHLSPGHFLIDPSLVSLLLSNSLPSWGLHAELQQLTRREREILSLLAAGFSNKAIAAQLGISQTTVKTHIAHIYRKLEIRGRASKCLRYPSKGSTVNNADARGQSTHLGTQE